MFYFLQLSLMVICLRDRKVHVVCDPHGEYIPRRWMMSERDDRKHAVPGISPPVSPHNQKWMCVELYATHACGTKPQNGYRTLQNRFWAGCCNGSTKLYSCRLSRSFALWFEHLQKTETGLLLRRGGRGLKSKDWSNRAFISLFVKNQRQIVCWGLKNSQRLLNHFRLLWRHAD